MSQLQSCNGLSLSSGLVLTTCSIAAWTGAQHGKDSNQDLAFPALWPGNPQVGKQQLQQFGCVVE